MQNSFWIIGDVHSCAEELTELLGKLNGKIIFVGDLFDRGPYPLETYNIIKDLFNRGIGSAVLGNHDDKLMRWGKGNRVLQNHGLDKTVEALNKHKEELKTFLKNIPHYKIIDEFVIVHASWRESLLKYGGEQHKKNRSWCLYGPNTGKTLEDGLPDRIDWVATREIDENSKTIIYGHQPHNEVRIKNKTYGIDTGCVFGGKLTALKIPEMEIISVKARKEYSIPLWK